MRAGRRLALTALVAALACDGGGGPSGPAPPEPFAGPGNVRRSVFAGDRDRFFEVHVPPGFDAGGALPLVIAFHGSPGTGETMRQITGFDAIADRERFFVVYPNSAVGEWALACGEFCTIADRHGIDDPAFVRALIAKMARDAPIDLSRVYAVGFSQGALFTHRLACTMGDRIAAFASVAATMLDVQANRCAPSAPVPILFIHGDADPEFPWEGRQSDFASSISFPATVDLWVGLNGCAAAPAVEELPDVADDGTTVRRETYGGCGGGSIVDVYVVENGGHTWPSSPADIAGGGLESQDVDASEVVWEFFEGR